MKSRPAYTLAELMVALLIMAVFLGGTTKAVMGLRRNASVRGAVDQFTAVHSLARATAVRMGRTSQLRADPAARRMWVEVQGTAVQGSTTYFEDGVRFSTDRTTLCFDPRGLAIETAGCDPPNATLVFSYSGRSDTLRTTTLGRIIR
jgi:prepilin-type N-terminal cleavage/methylation domain-containing protein